MTVKNYQHKELAVLAKQENRLAVGQQSDNPNAKPIEPFDSVTTQHLNAQRRKFLNMVTKSGIATRFLRANSFVAGALASRFAMAENGYAGKKIVIVALSQGAPRELWLPSDPTNTPEVSRPYQEKGVAGLMAFRHVNVINDGHATAWQAMGSPSIGNNVSRLTFDRKVAAVMGTTTPYPQMYLGANALHSEIQEGAPSWLYRISTAGTPFDGPQATLANFFNSTEISSDYTSAKLFIDAQRKDVLALKNKLCPEEQVRMDEHLEALVQLEKKLTGTSFNLAACNTSIPNVDVGDDTLNQGYGQVQLIASALACGLTNVAVLQVGDNHYPYHAASHIGNNSAYIAACRAQQTIPAQMLKLLAETKGADGAALINSTVLVVCNDMGDGRNDTPSFSPWGMATGLPGFKTGFSTGDGGNCRDFFSAIAVGLGLPSGTYTDIPGNPAAANILA